MAAQVEQELCIGCGRCADVCWHEGIELVGRKAHKRDACIGCGYCFQVCPTKALHVEQATILASAFSGEKQ
ncbi:MAG: 4Fe-4S dicluster domain-containing protein [Spirochaetia bacterium]|nr:4Fe-4S dicluster domain-containing protein [Spirochaetia bacterium]